MARVIVVEEGTRPALMTLARRNAPQGARVIADIFADESFIDIAIIKISWQGDGFTPALIIDTVKFFIEYGGRRLEHHWVLDLEDAFGYGNFSHEVAASIVDQIKLEFERMSLTRPTGYERIH